MAPSFLSFARGAAVAVLAAAAAACSSAAAEDDTHSVHDGVTNADPNVEADAHAHWPIVPQRGGTMAPFRLVSIVAPGDPLAADVFAFGDAVGGSTWWSTIAAEFGLGAFGGHAKWVGSAAMNAPEMNDGALVSYIREAIAAHAGDPAANVDDHTLYLLYLPEGTHSMDSATGKVNTNCGLTSGFHTYDPASHVVWGIIERCPAAFGWTVLQGVTQTAAHEIAEAATDPSIDRAHPGWDLACPTPLEPWKCSPFAVGTQGEIGDLCPETRWDEAGFLFTRVWSNVAARAGGDPCIPAAPSPWFGVTTAASWYPVSPGETARIDVDAWSTGDDPRPNAVGTYVAASSTSAKDAGGTFTARLEARRMRPGDRATLDVTVPAAAEHGDWAVLEIATSPDDDDEPVDAEHEYYVGVYVP